MKTAAEALEEEREKLRLTTGSSDLDSLIGGIEEGLFYLFYGEQEILDALIHRLIVNCVLPKNKGGFEAKGIYFNNTDYYTGKTILNPSELGELAKHVGIEPGIVFANVYAVAAYNEQRQLMVAKQVADLMEKDPSIRLLTIHNITKFFDNSKKPEETRQILNQTINYVWRIASKKQIAIVVTADAMPTGRGFIPKPIGGSFFRHIANVIVHLKKFYDGPVSSVKATLIKHPYKKTPDSIVLLVSKGGMSLMGRITPSFRQLYEETIGELKTHYQSSLLDLEHKHAFELLLKEAWNAEQAAMGNSNMPTVLDKLNLTANIHNRKLIEIFKRKLEEKDKVIEELKRDLAELKAQIMSKAGETKGLRIEK
jgi:RecA/RadA recombinase